MRTRNGLHPILDMQHKRPDFDRFVADRMAYMADIPLPPALKQALNDNDFGQMYLARANPYPHPRALPGTQDSGDTFLDSLRAVGPAHG